KSDRASDNFRDDKETDMTNSKLAFALATAVITVGITMAHAKGGAGKPAHVMLTPDAIQWGPFPAGGPGSQLAVVSGDPGKVGPFVIRLKTVDGFRIPPH